MHKLESVLENDTDKIQLEFCDESGSPYLDQKTKPCTTNTWSQLNNRFYPPGGPQSENQRKRNEGQVLRPG